MSSQGLSFAPASPGTEPAYFALHSAFVDYITAAQASSGFRVQTHLVPGQSPQ